MEQQRKESAVQEKSVMLDELVQKRVASKSEERHDETAADRLRVALSENKEIQRRLA